MLSRALAVIQLVIRILLAAGMMPYAISKLMRAQFQVSPVWYTTPLGDVPTTVLTWAFLGYSPWFQILLGASEFVPAILLFFRRTQTLGAIMGVGPDEVGSRRLNHADR